MKQKIKEAITQGYKNLGVPESVVDGLTALGVTVVQDESGIDAFVQSEAVKGVMKSWQSEADKVRTKASDSKKAEYEAKIAELEAKLNGNNPPEVKPEDDKVPAWAQALLEQNKALAEQNKAFTEKLNAFETTRTKEAAVAALDKFCAEWDYAGGFPKERDEAKRIALKVYKAGGEQMNGEQLIAAFREEFDPAVKDKGVTDFSKPFQSDGGAGASEAEKNAAFADEIRNALGIKKE
jgi:hypothetical protein